MMKNRLLVVVTNQDHYQGSEVPTGLWLSELTHFWDLMEQESVVMDIISPRGGRSPLEPKSLTGFSMDRSTRRRFKDSVFMNKLNQTRAAADVDWRDYDGIYYTGGHGVMFDFHNNQSLNDLNRNLYENGRIVASVCHGYCGLLNTRLSNGEFMVKDKKLTGFAWVEEKLAGVADKVPYNVEQEIKSRGARYKKSLLPFLPFVQRDGNLITGQNPYSAKRVAQQTLLALKELRLAGGAVAS